MSYKIENFPDSIRVGVFPVSCEVTDIHQAIAEQRYGVFSGVEQAIRLQPEFPHWTKAVDTVIHEVLHAIYWAYDIDGDMDEEATVSRMAAGLLQVLSDNQWLTVWLVQHFLPISQAPAPSPEPTETPAEA